MCVWVWGGGRRGSTQGIQSRRGQCFSAKPHIPTAASSPSFSVGCHTLAAAVLWLPTACKRFRACYTGDRHDGAYLQAQDRSVTDGRKPATKRKRTHCVLLPFPSFPRPAPWTSVLFSAARPRPRRGARKCLLIRNPRQNHSRRDLPRYQRQKQHRHPRRRLLPLLLPRHRSGDRNQRAKAHASVWLGFPQMKLRRWRCALCLESPTPQMLSLVLARASRNTGSTPDSDCHLTL